MTLIYSNKSPYRDYSEKERIEQARLDCGFSVDWKPSKELTALIPKFEAGLVNKTSRSLRTVEKFLEKFETYLNNINLDERNMNGTLIHNPKNIMATLEELPSFLLKIEELERQVKQGIVTTPTSKGDQELGWMAVNKPNLKEKSTNS